MTGNFGTFKVLREPAPGPAASLTAGGNGFYWCQSCCREVASGYWWSSSFFGQQGFLCGPCRNTIPPSTGLSMTITWTPTPR